MTPAVHKRRDKIVAEMGSKRTVVKHRDGGTTVFVYRTGKCALPYDRWYIAP